MAREWPFFQTLLSNMDMVLAKSDIGIASRYKDLRSKAARRTLGAQAIYRLRAGEFLGLLDLEILVARGDPDVAFRQHHVHVGQERLKERPFAAIACNSGRPSPDARRSRP